MDKLTALIEWMEQELKGHELIGSDYGLGLRSGIGRCIAKAKELEAAICDHKCCRNSGKDLRQSSPDQVPDKSYPAKTPEQIAAELYPDYKNGNDTVIPKPINHEQAAKRAAWLSRQPELDELKRQVEENKTTIDLQRQGLLKLQGEIAAKEKEVEELKKEKPGKWAVVNKLEIFDSKEQADKFYEGSDALDNLITVKIIQP